MAAKTDWQSGDEVTAATLNDLGAEINGKTTDAAVTAAINAAIANLLDGAPGALDTLNELAAAMGDDANFAATVTNALATKRELVSGTNRVYTTDSGGAQTSVPLSSSPTAQTIMLRTAGGVTSVGTPTDPAHATTKGYVDTGLSGKAAVDHEHTVDDIDATGTPSNTTYLRGDGAWATPPGGGGGSGITQLAEDPSPELGGSLELNGHTVGAATATDLADLHAATPLARTLFAADDESEAQSALGIDEVTLDDLARVTKQGYALAQEFYRIAEFPVDDSGNFASLIVTGRLGGWTTSNNAYWQMLLGNRSESYDGDTFRSSVVVTGNVAQALGTCELVAYGQTDKTAVLYVRVPADQYYSFDLAFNSLQVTPDFTGEPEIPTGDPIWALSNTPLLQVWPNGEVAFNQVRLGWGPTEATHASPKYYVDDGLAGKANLAHGHGPADLGGTPTPTTFYRGDGTWVVPTNTTYSALALAEFTTGTATTSRAITALLLNQMINQKITGASATAPTAIGQDIAKAADGPAVRTLIGAVDSAYVAAQIANLIASAPGAMDTLDELAAALGDDPNFAATITNALALKAPLAAPALTGAATLDGQALVKTNDSRLSLAQTAVQPAALAAAQVVAVRSVTGTTDTLVLADQGKAIECSNAAAITLTVPPNSSVAFPVGTVIEVLQVGGGQVTVAAGSGVTINNAGSLSTRAQWSVLTLRKRGTDTWLLAGDMA
ncbi:hypothetical protein [Gordonia sp. OPL2]|uniref:hypothetical protein n=1 Tax=Gordonia sp. OPL2 TaxID=2486274 RepID=UPI001CA40546|nr:hypothetical protein [Gordonia sp. OPL2]